MKLARLDVEGEMGVKDGTVCVGCSNVIYDLAYFPKDWDSDEAQILAQAVKSNNLFMESSDPHTFVFCEQCKDGFAELARTLLLSIEVLKKVNEK
jgi:hypothetical protein